MATVFIYLNPIDKLRMLASTVNQSDFIGILSPHIRSKASDGDLVMIMDDPQKRSFFYVVKGDGDYLKNDSGGMIPLSKGRSLTGVLMDKLSNNNFTKTYNDVKKAYSDIFNFTQE